MKINQKNEVTIQKLAGVVMGIAGAVLAAVVLTQLLNLPYFPMKSGYVLIPVIGAAEAVRKWKTEPTLAKIYLVTAAAVLLGNLG